MPDISRNKNSTAYTVAVGRRKEAIARVRLFNGKGETLVNNHPIEKYFDDDPIAKFAWEKPFSVTKLEGNYFATIKVNGSGKKSQLDAVVHGLARALNIAEPKSHKLLKTAGLLTRDPRVKERRKYGLAQKARKGKQSPKR